MRKVRQARPVSQNFPLRHAQKFLRCIALGHIELVFAKLFLMHADHEIDDAWDHG